jgi:hypothetical protein
VVPIGELLLGQRGSVRIVEPFQVSCQDRLVSDRPDEAEQVHRHARLVPVGVGDQHARPVGVYLEDRPESGVQFRVHEDHMLSVVHRVHGDPCPEFDLSGCFDHCIDAARFGNQRGVFGDGKKSPGYSVFQILQGSYD